jgi:hypothetical protein
MRAGCCLALNGIMVFALLLMVVVVVTVHAVVRLKKENEW